MLPAPDDRALEERSMEARKYVAEAIGTFVLVVIGSLSILSTGATAGPALVIVPLGFGLALLAGIAIVGHVSGAHFNPAVTLAALADRRIGVPDAVAYVIAQAGGAIAASAVILILFDQTSVATTANRAAAGEFAGFALEILLTAVFVAVILTVTRRAASLAVLVIPLTLIVIHVAGIPFSGRSLALLSQGVWRPQMLYASAPARGFLYGVSLHLSRQKHLSPAPVRLQDSIPWTGSYQRGQSGTHLHLTRERQSLQK
jgi:aquaporin Z